MKTATKHLFRRYAVKLVKENAGIYEAPNKVSSARDVAEVCYKVLRTHELATEKMHVFFLDTKNHITGFTEISSGTLNASLIHPREVFKAAIMHNAYAIIISHNHPSGDTAPSNADKRVTTAIREAAKLLQIELLDHVITGDFEDGESPYQSYSYTSFRELGLLND